MPRRHGRPLIAGVSPVQMQTLPHVATQMGDTLRQEVERQLLINLDHYRPGSSTGDLTIDWSDPRMMSQFPSTSRNTCRNGHLNMQEGNCTWVSVIRFLHLVMAKAKLP
jgi:hypothetical protein